MVDPVVCADTRTYEESAIRKWLASGKDYSPMTNDKLEHTFLTANRNLKEAIGRWREEHEGLGWY